MSENARPYEDWTNARPYEDWTTEDLKELESTLYDDEVAGLDVWFMRDQILNELNWRNEL